jgi:hypothetical protein
VSRQSWEQEVQERWQKYRWWVVGGIVVAVLIAVAGVIAGNKSESDGRSGDRQRIGPAERRIRPAENSRHRVRKVRTTAESRPFHNKARACGSYSGKDRFACEDSYEICAAEAPHVVEKSYHEEGPSFEEWAFHYAKGTYTGHADPYEDLVWQAGYAGCLEAMAAESERLHG